jgi:hypothetical protein
MLVPVELANIAEGVGLHLIFASFYLTPSEEKVRTTTYTM